MIRSKREPDTLTSWQLLSHGALQPSLPALAGTVLVTAALWFACVLLITPSFMVNGGAGYVAWDNEDDYAFLSAQLLAVRSSDHPGRAIAIVGSSSLREGISSAERIGKNVSRETGADIEVRKLTASALSVWEYSAVLETVEDRFDVVVLGISPNRLARSQELLQELARHPRLAISSDAFDDEVLLAGLEPLTRFGNYFLDNMQFFSARLPKLLPRLLSGPIEDVGTHYDGVPNVSEERYAQQIERIRDVVQGYEENVDENLAVLARAIKSYRRNTPVQFVLLEGPLAPRASNVYPPEIQDHYRERITRFATNNDLQYWNLNHLGWHDEDFHDWAHLKSPSGRELFTTALSVRLAELVASGGAGAGMAGLEATK